MLGDLRHEIVKYVKQICPMRVDFVWNEAANM